MNPWTAMGLVLGALGLLMGVTRLLCQRGTLGPEASRKTVHIGMGVICLAFPWLFSAVWPVWLLAVLACIGLVGVRAVPVLRQTLGGVLHGVRRVSWGELYFPIGVAAVFTLSAHDWVRFVVPVAILTFADAAGALVGKRWGRHRFETLEGTKSVEGSAAVGVTAALATAVPLLLAGHAPLAVLLIALLLGLFALLLEAIAWEGLDNVFLPLATYAQVSVCLLLPLTSISNRLLVLIAITLLARLWRRGRVVDESARLGGALALYVFWAVGGWQWLVGPVLLLVSYLRLMPAIPGGIPKHNLVAVICVASSGLVWTLANAFAPDPRWLWPFTLGIAAQQAVIALVRFSQAHPSRPRIAWWAAAVGQAALVQFGAFACSDRGMTVPFAGYGIGFLGLAAAVGGFALWERQLQMPEDLSRRWWKQGTTALVASAAGLFLLHG